MSLTYKMYCEKCDLETEHKIEILNSGEIIAKCECGNKIKYWRQYQ